MARVYLTVVALGKGLASRQDWNSSHRLQRVRYYQPAIKGSVSTVHLSDQFRANFQSLSKLVRHFTQIPNSSWKMSVNDAEPRATVNDMASLYSWMSAVRRLTPGKHVPGKQGASFNFGVSASVANPPKKRAKKNT